MKKIIHITTFHTPFDTRIFHRECKTLYRAGYDVSLVTHHTHDEVIEGIKILSLPKRSNNRLRRIFLRLWKAFNIARAEKADIYHFHDPEFLILGLLLKLFTKGKVIYDVHEDEPKRILEMDLIPPTFRRFMSKIYNFYEKWASKHYDSIITATEGIAENFQSLNPFVIHNYPDLCMLPKQKKPKNRTDGNNLIYIGGITKHRGAFEMIRALENIEPITNIHLTLVGPMSPANFESELINLPSYHSVKWHDRLPWVDAWNMTYGMKAGLLIFHPIPNHIQALPNKMFEYMMCGLPVVASNFPLWKEIIEVNKCGICVNPLDIDEISNAIVYILTHPEEARIMGENGRTAVREKYNWDIEGEKLCLLYETFFI